jgi:hypothetical protein
LLVWLSTYGNAPISRQAPAQAYDGQNFSPQQATMDAPPCPQQHYACRRRQHRRDPKCGQRTGLDMGRVSQQWQRPRHAQQQGYRQQKRDGAQMARNRLEIHRLLACEVFPGRTFHRKTFQSGIKLLVAYLKKVSKASGSPSTPMHVGWAIWATLRASDLP